MPKVLSAVTSAASTAAACDKTIAMTTAGKELRFICPPEYPPRRSASSRGDCPVPILFCMIFSGIVFSGPGEESDMDTKKPTDAYTVTSLDDLAKIYAKPLPRTATKETDYITETGRAFIAAEIFVKIGKANV